MMLLFASCEEQTAPHPADIQSESLVTQKSSSTPYYNGWKASVVQNANNYVDSIGWYHNEALDGIATNGIIPSRIDSSAIAYFCSFGTISISNCTNELESLLDTARSHQAKYDYPPFKVPSNSEPLFDSLVAIFDKYESRVDSSYLFASYDLDTITTEIVQWEGLVLTSSLNADDELTLLAMGSVARHSLEYCHAESLYINPAWGAVGVEPSKWRGFRFFQAFTIALSDAIGAGLGAGLSVQLGAPTFAPDAAIIVGGIASAAVTMLWAGSESEEE